MKWINAEQQVTVTIYDEEHEEHLDKVMTVEEMLDTYTNEGCPTIYSNPAQKTGKWIQPSGVLTVICSQCQHINNSSKWNFCPNCGARMEREEE